MPNCLLFPLLGNPNGRVFEAIPKGWKGDSPEVLKLAAEIISRHGDLFPLTGIIEVYLDNSTPEYEIVFTRNFDDLPTTLELRNPSGNPHQQVLPGL